MFKLDQTPTFEKHFDELWPETKDLLEPKIRALKTDPFRHKRLQYPSMLLFRIRFSDRRREKRLVYAVSDDLVRLICILDGKRGYKDLRKYV